MAGSVVQEIKVHSRVEVGLTDGSLRFYPATSKLCGGVRHGFDDRRLPDMQTQVPETAGAPLFPARTFRLHDLQAPSVHCQVRLSPTHARLHPCDAVPAAEDGTCTS
jgi:hypothetical protein